MSQLPDGFPASAARSGSLCEARLVCTSRVQLTVLFPPELYQQFLPSSSLPAAHSHPMVVLAQLFSWDYMLNWANELFWVKNSPAKVFFFMQGGSPTVLLQDPPDREDLKFRQCHRGMRVCVHAQIKSDVCKNGAIFTIFRLFSKIS